MSDADQTIGTNRGVSQAANSNVVITLSYSSQMNTITAATNTEFILLVLNSTSSFRGNTEGVFYGGMAAATAISYQLVEG